MEVTAAMDWSDNVDAEMRRLVELLLDGHDAKHWQALMVILHPRVVTFAAAALRRASGRGVGRIFERTADGASPSASVDEQALDVAVMVCADLRRHGYRRLAMFRGQDEREGAPLRGYISKITRQTAFRYLRSQVLRPDGGRRAITSEAQSAGPATLDRLRLTGGRDTAKRTARHIMHSEQHLELLSPQQRDVLELYLCGYSAAEIADLLEGQDLDAPTTQQVIRSAKAKLKYYFGTKEAEP